jgi:peptidyl-prolyl cis-trans isomerase D
VNVSHPGRRRESPRRGSRRDPHRPRPAKLARDQYTDILDQIEELRAAFRPLPEIAERFGLEGRKTVNMTAGGAELSDAGVTCRRRARQGCGAIFDAETGRPAPAVSLSANNNIWFDLKAVEPARDQTLDEVRDAVTAAMDRGEDQRGRHHRGRGHRSRASRPACVRRRRCSATSSRSSASRITRNGDGTPVLNQRGRGCGDLRRAARDHFGSAINGDGDHVIFQVVEIVPAEGGTSSRPSHAFVDETRPDSRSTRTSSAGLLDEAGLRINQQALNHEPAQPQHHGAVDGDDQFTRFAAAYDAGRAQIVFRRVVADLETPSAPI